MTKYCGKDFLLQRGYQSAGAWASGTVYALGAVVKNDTAPVKIYVCIQAGTSAGSGGPTGTSSSITDNTCKWRYVSALTTIVGVSGEYGFSTIGNMTATSLTVNNEQVDVTDKGSVPWRELKACGVRSMDASCSGKFSDDYHLDQLVAAANNGTFQYMRMISGVGDSFFASFIINKVTRDGEYNGAEQYSIDFASAGDVTYTAAP